MGGENELILRCGAPVGFDEKKEGKSKGNAGKVNRAATKTAFNIRQFKRKYTDWLNRCRT